ncbi:MAG: serine/threonine protein kinase, partial [Rhizobacter sp.]|nr:serine/threonine protein kinase [Rhizobacter sp.]
MVAPAPPRAQGGAANDDDQRTVVGSPLSVGPALPFGHAVQEFVIEALIGEGGFGIVYLAHDKLLGRKVALKEYMPSNLAMRSADRSVAVRSERHRETFELGLRSFVNEAQLLASFDHPSLVKVYRFWEENGTAYMVMPYYQGPTLKKWLAGLAKPPDERWLLALLAPMIDALEQLHHDHCYHRDIAPDNILLLPLQGTQTGATSTVVRPLLLDFGAARRVIGDMTHALTVILKPGYAPIEQYAESAAMKQGPWTDVYALSAVLYTCVTGHAPAPSVSRIIADEMVPAAVAGAGRYTPPFLEAIDAGLVVRPEARPQSMLALRELFAATSHGETTRRRAPKPVEPDPAHRIDPVLAAEQATVAAPPRRRDAARPAASAPAPPSSRAPLLAGLATAALLLVGAGTWWLTGTGDAQKVPGTASAPSPSPGTAA